jgi:hypothetical protein
VSCVQILALDSLYSEINFLRKLGFLVGPDFSLKQVFLGKQLYIKLKTSKVSEKYSISYSTNLIFIDTNFKLLSEDNGTWHSVQVRSLEREKNQHILGKLS